MENEARETKYNGWTNYETWLVSLWLDNDQASYRYWREEADRCLKHAPNLKQVRDGVWTVERAPVFMLADQLKKEVTEKSPLSESGMYADLLGAALSEVDWQEIVEHWLTE